VIRVFLVEDQTLVREGIRSLLALDPEIAVTGEAADGAAAVDAIPSSGADVVLLDMRLPRMSGLEVLRALAAAGALPPTIILTTFDDDELLLEGLRAGAKGYLLKDSALEEIANALNSVVRGQPFISPELSGYLLRRMDRIGLLAKQTPGLNDLTTTEKRVLKLIASYKTSKEIAEELHIHYRTVDNHRTNIAAKLGLQGSHSLLKFAVEHQDELA